MESRGARILIRVASLFTLAFLYIPLTIVFVYAFNPSRGQEWPPPGFTTQWFGLAWRNDEVRTALLNSLKAGGGATLIALILGTAAAFAVHRFRFFGRETVSFVLVLPIALPGIVTGMALNSAINFGGDVFGLSFGLFTIILGHATFCVVVVYNNVVARLRRTPGSLVEASMDLGADGWQTFRHVTLPALSTALVAGALLAFALSFDEIIVTNFTSGATTTTLPEVDLQPHPVAPVAPHRERGGHGRHRGVTASRIPGAASLEGDRRLPPGWRPGAAGVSRAAPAGPESPP